MIRMGSPEGFESRDKGSSPDLKQMIRDMEVIVTHLGNIRERLVMVMDDAEKIFPEESIFVDSILDMLDHVDQAESARALAVLSDPSDIQVKLILIDRWLEVLIDNADFILGGDNVAPGVPTPPAIKAQLDATKSHPLWGKSWLPAIKEIRRLAESAKQRKA